MVNLQELLDEIDVYRKVTGVRLEDLYNLMLKKGWTFGSPQLTALMHLVIRLFHSRQVGVLERFWRSERPDMVVSLVPNFDRALRDGLARACPASRSSRSSPTSPTTPAFLDRAAGAVSHLRVGQGSRAGAAHGHARKRSSAFRG